MADSAFLMFYGMTGGIKSFLFDVGHDNATVAVIVIYPIVSNLPVTVRQVCRWLKNLWGVPYPPPMLVVFDLRHQ